MRILNYRKGFASNSSSTHSSWIVKNRDNIESYTTNGTCFGWNEFICSDRKSLIRYLAAQVAMNIDYCCLPNNPGRSKDNIDYLVGEEVFDSPKEYSDSNLYVDHSSVWVLPRDKDDTTGLPSKKFIQFIKKYLLENNIVIFGENDNDDRPVDEIYNVNKEDLKKEFLLDYLEDKDLDRDKIYCVNDGDVWKIFDKRDGEKITFTVNEFIKEYPSSSDPELVDLIITNKCECNCPFCYRGCSENGEEAKFENVRQYIKAIEDLDTFEVAIGGGDILLYPELDDLLAFLESERKNRDLIYNTTIKYPQLISNVYRMSKYNNPYSNKINKLLDEYRTKLKKIAGIFSGVAFSISSDDEVKSYITSFHEIFLNSRCEVSFQIIPEMLTFNEIKQILDVSNEFGLRVTMLGYKKTKIGREDNSTKEYIKKTRANKLFVDKLVDIVNEIGQYGTISLDTQLLKNLPKLKEHLDPRTYRLTEGTHSCCIDATKNVISVSSYDFSKDCSLNPSSSSLSLDIRTAFQEFNSKKNSRVFFSVDKQGVNVGNLIRLEIFNPKDKKKEVQKISLCIKDPNSDKFTYTASEFIVHSEDDKNIYLVPVDGTIFI